MMPKDRADTAAPAWSVPIHVDEVPESGRRYALAADAPARQALARQIGVDGIADLKTDFDVTRHGKAGLRVAGTVSAKVQQTCVVTLEPLENEVAEALDVVFVPDPPEDTGGVTLVDASDPPESMVNGRIDLGALAGEFLALSVDPYPRKPDAAFTAAADEKPGEHPFAALAALKKGRE
jgi:uncharacterized metal-binding protein YceD (DUF177 family)